MMNKAIPLALLATSVLGQNYFTSTNWAPVAGVTASSTCCTIMSAVAIGATNTATTTAGTDAACVGFTSNTAAASTYTNAVSPATTGAFVIPISLTASTGGKTGTSPSTSGYSASNSAAAAGTSGNPGNGAGSWVVGTDATTMTWQPNNIGASTACPAQTLNRVSTALPDAVGTWTVATGTADTGVTCCFLDPSTNVVVTTTGSLTSITAGKYATSSVAACSTVSGGDYRKGLKAAASGVTAYTAIDLGNQDTYTLNSDKSTITLKYLGTTGCSQVLTKVPNSGVHLASIMTPVVIGGAMAALAL